MQHCLDESMTDDRCFKLTRNDKTGKLTSSGKCKLASTLPWIELSIIQHLDMENGKIVNLETSAELYDFEKS
jgi:hypothetical protein